mmetsp:Transcript_45702/g.97411  ORF Transcript_45702/g.97411 Transcript_45702/m.97411 type:complete len:354 (+) Transcript_45702:275-1336(+)
MLPLRPRYQRLRTRHAVQRAGNVSSAPCSMAVAARRRSTMGCSTLRAAPSCELGVYEVPASHARVSAGSKGTLPRKGTPKDCAMPSAPPLAAGNTSEKTLSPSSCGHLSARAAWISEVTSAPEASRSCTELKGARKPDMFSTTPRIRVLVFAQKESSLRTSIRLTSCGVLTMSAPSEGPSALERNCTREMCSSDVPGGVSISRKSSCPHSTSVRNCLISPFLRGPRQMTASSSLGSMKPMDITPNSTSSSSPPSAVAGAVTYTGDQPEALWCTLWPRSPSICGMDGPQMSTSSSPTRSPRAASANASCADIVLLPTPPFPESTSTIRCTSDRRDLITARSGSSLRPSPSAQAF